MTSVTLLGGSPGAGKSSLALQVIDNVAEDSACLYIAAEEGLAQVRQRADRFNLRNIQHIMVLSALEERVDIMSSLDIHKPRLVILDSLPSYVGIGPGAAQEARELVLQLKGYAVDCDAAVIIIDHIVKTQELAGPMGWQHSVDTVVACRHEVKGKKTTDRRIVSVSKNRFGPTPSRSVFLMTERGLVGLEQTVTAHKYL